MNAPKRNRFGWFVVFAMAVAVFLCFKCQTVAKAAAPNQAVARLIYANNLNEGNATATTTYNFSTSDGFEPYAIYITQDTGSEITISSSSFTGVDYASIRIWNNNCQVVIDANSIDSIDHIRLIQAGNNAFLDLGWLHYERSDQYNVSTYTGTDDAESIAAFFNGFNAASDQGVVNYENFEFNFEPLGNAEVISAAKKYIYAYASLDYDGDGDADGDDLKMALAEELLNKFRDFYGPFGMFGDYRNIDDFRGDAEAFRGRVDIDFANPVTVVADVTNAYTQSHDISRFTATINWGHTASGTDITCSVYVYQLNQPEDLLICTDFDESTGSGSTFFVRCPSTDCRVLVGDVAANPSTVDEDYFASVIVTNTIGNVAAGGHAVSLYEKNTDRNLYTFQTVSYFEMKNYEGGSWHPLNFDTFVKIFTTSGYYFATASEGEAKAYDFVSNANGNASDKIWEAGGDSPVKLFIHNNILHIMPLNTNSGVAKELREVRLTGDTPSGAVAIDNSNHDDIVITFNSKFYDTVSFTLEYTDDTTAAFIVEREGIIIQYTGLDGSGLGRYWLDIYGEGQGNELNYDYDPTSENFVVMATYYHSSAETGRNDLKLIVTYDDGSTEVISSTDSIHNFTGYKAGSSYSAVDTTTFIIGFMNASGTGFTFSKNNHTGGFSVQVVNAGFNAEDSFGGALAGSGKGKYWDGIANITY